MKKTIIKGSVFVLTFLVAVLIVSALMNKGNTDMTAVIQPSGLPLVSILYGEISVNTMSGFTERMDDKYMKDTVTPLKEDRRLAFTVDKAGQGVEAVSFEVRSTDGSRLIESTEITDYKEENDVITADVILKDLIDANVEYGLTILLTLSDGREIRYYTHILQNQDIDTKEILDFAINFSDATFEDTQARAGTEGKAGEAVGESQSDVSAADEMQVQSTQEGPVQDLPDDRIHLATYLEPNEQGDNTTLSRVTIHSSLKQLKWADLAVERVTRPAIYIRDAGPQTAAVTLRYLVRYDREGTEILSVINETFRIRRGNERTYLLDYDRTMEDTLDEDGTTFSGSRVMLGIVPADIPVKESDGGKVLAFAQAGTLYSYNITDHKLARLFSCYEGDGDIQVRLSSALPEMKVLQVDEAGNVTFLLYGYMNRGRYEGRCGVLVYRYSDSLNTVEEQVFIPSGRSPEIMKAEVDRLNYVNGKNELYLMLDQSIVCVNLDQKTYTDVADNLVEENYRVSENNRMIVWQDGGNKLESTGLTLMNLNTGEKTSVTAQPGCYVMPLGFMGEDLIYGTARKSDIRTDNSGIPIFPMYKVEIEDENGTVLMNYQKDGYFITGCVMEKNQITLNRVKKNESGEYAAAESDQIMDSNSEDKSINKVTAIATGDYGKLVQINMKNSLDDKKIKLLTPGEVLYEGSRLVSILSSDEPQETCYVYGIDGSVQIFTSPKEAVSSAYERSGSVTGRDGRYIWKKERMNLKNQIMAITAGSVTSEKNSVAVCLDAMFSYMGISRNSETLLTQEQSILDILQETMNQTQVLDLSGLNLDSLLYYPDREIPVLVILQDGNAMLITGFNELNVVVMDPVSGKIGKMGMNDAAAYFAENGNHFITYVEK